MRNPVIRSLYQKYYYDCETKEGTMGEHAASIRQIRSKKNPKNPRKEKDNLV
jgi:hypothetical protein